jgi:hypothetical protein
LALADVRGGPEDHRDAVERAEELDEQFERTGALIDEIAEFYPALTLEDIHTAIAYYYAHIDEFRDAHRDAETPA